MLKTREPTELSQKFTQLDSEVKYISKTLHTPHCGFDHIVRIHPFNLRLQLQRYNLQHVTFYRWMEITGRQLAKIARVAIIDRAIMFMIIGQEKNVQNTFGK